MSEGLVLIALLLPGHRTVEPVAFPGCSSEFAHMFDVRGYGFNFDISVPLLCWIRAFKNLMPPRRNEPDQKEC